MPTTEEYNAKIVNAHRAGDVVSAKRLAAMRDRDAETPPRKTMQDTLREGKMVVQPTSPEREAAMQDSFFGGFGNEAAAALGAGKDALMNNSFQGIRGNYDARLAEKEALKDDASLIDTIGPAMMSGTGVAKVINPKTLKQAIGLGTVEGGVFGAGSEKPGERGKGAAVGAVTGGAASTVIPLAAKLMFSGIPKATKGLHDMFSPTTPQPYKEAAADGDKFLANFFNRLGLTPEKAASLGKKKFDADDTLADVTSEQSSALIPGVAASSDEAAEVARKSSIATRQDPDTLVSRVQKKSGMDTSSMEGATQYHGDLREAKQAIGSQIDEYVDSVSGVPVKNQDKIDDFFELKAAKGLKNEVNESLELRERGPLYDGDGDVNAQVYDAAFLQETSSRLGKRISQMKKEGIDHADAQELKTQFDNLYDEAVKDSPLRAIKSEYAAASRKQRAFESGLSGKSSTGAPYTTRVLKKELDAMAPADREAFKNGALANYAEKGDELLKALGSPTERRRISLIFGDEKAEAVKKLSEQEAGFATISEKLTGGVSDQSRKVARDTLKGDLDGIDSLFKRLENKRAYSPIGAAGLFINEVVSIIHQSKLSNEAINHIMKKVSVSGDDINKVLKQMAEVDIPKLERDRLIKTEMDALAKAVTSGYGGAAGSLSERLTSGGSEE